MKNMAKLMLNPKEFGTNNKCKMPLIAVAAAAA
jgi:hypothetical protein